MFKKIISIVLLGVMMATLMSLLLGCDDVDKKTVAAIQNQLSEKYGESFTVYALGDRIGRDTVTAYVYADGDPSMLFTARLDKNGELTFDNYSYRIVCRKTDKLLTSQLSSFGIESIAYTTYENKDYSLALDISPAEYVTSTASAFCAISLVVKDTDAVCADDLLRCVASLREQLGDILIGISVYKLSADDYNTVYDAVLHETQIFDAYRLSTMGTSGDIVEATFQYDANGCSMTAEQIDQLLSKEAD